MHARLLRSLLPLALCVVTACNDPVAADDGGGSGDAGAVDGGRDAGDLELDAGDIGDEDAGDLEDAGESDAGQAGDAGAIDTGDAGLIDAGESAHDAGREEDAGLDAGPLDAGPPDAGPPDAGPPDAGPADPCDPLPAGLTTWTRSDSAASGTPDTYVLDVVPGTPFCASITGGGGGRWWVNVSNGTSSGVYCYGDATCSILVPAGQNALMVTAVTDDIGYYTLTVRYRPL